MKRVVSLSLSVIFASIILAGCSYSVDNRLPSPSPQELPVATLSEKESPVESSSELNNKSSGDAPFMENELQDTSYLDDPIYQEIFNQIDSMTNDQRFEEINELLAKGLIDKAKADRIYLQVEEGESDSLAYEIYLNYK